MESKERCEIVAKRGWKCKRAILTGHWKNLRSKFTPANRRVKRKLFRSLFHIVQEVFAVWRNREAVMKVVQHENHKKIVTTRVKYLYCKTGMNIYIYFIFLFCILHILAVITVKYFTSYRNLLRDYRTAWFSLETCATWRVRYIKVYSRAYLRGATLEAFTEKVESSGSSNT